WLYVEDGRRIWQEWRPRLVHRSGAEANHRFNSLAHRRNKERKRGRKAWTGQRSKTERPHGAGKKRQQG
ncbi:MAG: hypothetical protein ACK56F_21285, partial [bacterium]